MWMIDLEKDPHHRLDLAALNPVKNDTKTMPQAILFDAATAMTAAARPKLSTSYPQEQVLAAALEYFQNDELAATTWINKYALRNPKGELLELTPPTRTHWRMAARVRAH
jgi:hypothetical protein